MIDIVIPAFNQVDLTWRCLTHLFAFPANDMRVILVDDGSTDSTPLVGEWLRRRGHKYIRHYTNKGPHAAWNTGYRAGCAPRVLFLNNDVAVFGFTLEYFEHTRLPYACVSEVVGKWDPGEMAVYVDALQCNPPWGYEDSQPGYQHSCFAVDRGILARVGGFDEQFFLTYGDTDFMLRVKDETGVEPVILKKAVAFHGVSVTRRRAFGLEGDTNRDLADRERFEAKWAGRPEVLAAHPRAARSKMIADRQVAWKDGEDARRPGRLGRRLDFPAPGLSDRLAIIRAYATALGLSKDQLFRLEMLSPRMEHPLFTPDYIKDMCEHSLVLTESELKAYLHEVLNFLRDLNGERIEVNVEPEEEE